MVSSNFETNIDEISYSAGEDEQHVQESKYVLKFVFFEDVSFSASDSDKKIVEEADHVQIVTS